MSGLFRSKVLPTMPNIPVINPKPVSETPPVKSNPELPPLPPKNAAIIRYSRCNREMAAGYETLWKNCEIRSQFKSNVNAVVSRIKQNQERYATVAHVIKMPWELIAALHTLEAGGNFKGVMHNGELIIGTGRKTTLVPKGRGPFNTWEESCEDAIGVESRRPAGYRFDVANTLFYAEMFNGFGYRGKGINSPYLWSYTNNYSKGKYVSDGVWSSTAVSQQCGVVPILLGLNWKPESWN